MASQSLLDDGRDSSSSRTIARAISFVLRRIIVPLIVGIPVLYILHLVLLAVYSRILVNIRSER